MAAPLVTGTVALVEAAHPTWSMSQVIDAVLDTHHPRPQPRGQGDDRRHRQRGAPRSPTPTARTWSRRHADRLDRPPLGGLTGVTVTFNEEINPATFTAAQVTLTGPSGAIGGRDRLPGLGLERPRVHHLVPRPDRRRHLHLDGRPAIQDWYGNEMNQNRNGVNGEASDAYTETIQQPLTLSLSGLPASVTAGKSAELHRHGDGARRGRRCELHRHRPFQQHRPHGRPAVRVHLHRRRRRATPSRSPSRRPGRSRSPPPTR